MDPISMDGLLAKLQEARALVSGSPARPAAVSPGTSPAASPTSAKQVDFGAMLKGSIDRVDQAQNTANQMAEQFQLGDPKITLEDTMVSLQKANISFQAALQIRNRVVSAYHDIMNLQI